MRNSNHKSPLSRSEIDALWMHAAGQLGFKVTGTDAAYATSDGCGGIAIGVPETLDTDDCVAQLVFHELCHALVEGESRLHVVDWGLCNDGDVHVQREYASLRVQAHLCDPYGLRDLMAPTTEWRPYYEALPSHALEGTDEAARVAIETMQTPLFHSWKAVLCQALQATANALAAQASPCARTEARAS